MILPIENTFKKLFRNAFGFTLPLSVPGNYSFDRPRGVGNRPNFDFFSIFSGSIIVVAKSMLYVIDIGYIYQIGAKNRMSLPFLVL